MKKLFIGFIIGALFMVSAQAFGDSISFKGLKIEGQTSVTINDEKIGDAIIVEGKSFVPVREITEGFGGKVEKASGKGIALTTNTTNTTISGDSSKLEEEIQKQKTEIADTKSKIKATNEKVTQYGDLKSSSTNEVLITMYQNNYDAFKKSLDQLELDLSKQESKLADLEAQLAALK